ncbi:MAG TPA: sulfotransferase domain-containing protein [Anaerolineales bacterium]|nr:sulfotransferase domain-containing protein [Anaerolineales bacterium]
MTNNKFVPRFQKWLNKGKFALRKLSANSRYLPSFIIAGAQKTGTTSLHYYLSQHPELVTANVKEVHFFDGGTQETDCYLNGVDWYKAHFPLVRQGLMAFEASPRYMFIPFVPQRIYSLLPTVKLIFLLRNPTERAISHYFHNCSTGFEKLPVWDALHLEEQRLAPSIATKAYRSVEFRRYSYKSRGLYAQQLELFYNLFSPSQILLLSSEQFFKDPLSTLKEVYDFIGVDSRQTVKNLSARNISENRTKVDSKIYDYLNEYFYDANVLLSNQYDNQFIQAWIK